MRENRLYGSEGGEAKSLPYPYQGPHHAAPGLLRRFAPRNDGNDRSRMTC